MTDATSAEAFAAFMAARLAPNGTPPPEQPEQYTPLDGAAIIDAQYFPHHEYVELSSSSSWLAFCLAHCRTASSTSLYSCRRAWLDSHSVSTNLLAREHRFRVRALILSGTSASRK